MRLIVLDALNKAPSRASLSAAFTQYDEAVRVTAVVVHYDSTRLPAVLASLRAQSWPLRETFVIGVGPSTARATHHIQNRGFGFALNCGAKLSDSEFLLLMNDDTILDPEALRTLMSAIDRDDTLAAVGPVLTDQSGSRAFGGRIVGRRHQLEKQVTVAEPAPEIVYADWLDGAAMLVRSEVFRAVGGYCPDYFLYFEDADLSIRFRKTGWNVAVATHALANHTTSDRWYFSTSLIVRNELLFLMRVAPRTALVYQLLWLLRSSAVGLLRRDRTAIERLRGLQLFLLRRWGPVVPRSSTPL